MMWSLLGILACFNQDENQEIQVYGNPNTYTQAPLTLGEQPPLLNIQQWLRGSPITKFEKEKVYLVEFWASWCNPCQKSIPHLNQIQEKYGPQGLEVVAIAANEAHGYGEAKGSKPLAQFLKRRGQTMRYTVGYTAAQETYGEWVEAARLSGLPWVFVIDREGLIAWIGQPFHESFDRVLAQIVANTHQREQLKRRHEINQQERVKGWDLADQFWQAMDRQDWQKALGFSQRLRRMDPDWFYYESAMAFNLMWSYLDQKKSALQFAEDSLKGFLKEKPEGLGVIVHQLLKADKIDAYTRDLAYRLTKQMLNLTRAEDPATLLMMAQVANLKGHNEKAEAYLNQAEVLADKGLVKQILEERKRLKNQN